MATGGEERVIVSLKVNFKGNTVDYIAIGIELFSDTVMWETIFGGIIWRQRHKTSDAYEPHEKQVSSFRKIKTKYN